MTVRSVGQICAYSMPKTLEKVKIRVIAIDNLLEDSPGLRHALQNSIDRAWQDARKGAEAETELHRDTFPQACPWAFDTFMDDDFWPDKRH